MQFSFPNNPHHLHRHHAPRFARVGPLFPFFFSALVPLNTSPMKQFISFPFPAVAVPPKQPFLSLRRKMTSKRQNSGDRSIEKEGGCPISADISTPDFKTSASHMQRPVLIDK
mmetsp:Transcript_51020/g.100288  ORF Transcript_51020/g.100288 Transcript_51020/m.100288 type:complete len:113 (+) Transcript_51020:540-878(+)